MNEMCKYCETSGTCLEIAEYDSIYCRLHRRIPIVIEKTYEELKKENQQLKEQVAYMRRSIERKEEQMIDLQHERVPIVDEEKQELIDYLKKEIKEQEHKKDTSHCGLDIVYANGKIKSYQEILSKIEKE